MFITCPIPTMHPLRNLLLTLAAALTLSLPGCGGSSDDGNNLSYRCRLESLLSCARNPGTGWAGPVPLAASDGVASGVRVAQNANGRTLVVWEREAAGMRSVQVRFVPTGLNPEVPVTLDSASAGAPRTPDVAMDAEGRAMVVWVQAQGGANRVWARRYHPGTGWEPAEVLDPAAEGADAAPRVAMHRNGEALVAWLRATPDDRRILARAYRPGAGWGPEWRMDVSGLGTLPPVVAVDTGGRGMVLWPQQNSIFENNLPPWGRDVDLASGAGTTSRVESIGLDAYLPQLTALGDGSVLAAWSATAGNNIRVLGTSQYTAAGGWSVPLEARGDVADLLSISLAAGSGAISAVMWCESQGGRHRLGLRRLNGAQILGSAPMFVTDEPDTVRLVPQLKLDARGEAVWIWLQGPESAAELWSNTLSDTDVPGIPQRVDLGASAGASSAALVLEPSGLGMAAWTQNTGIGHRVWVARRYP